jgi:hypothetical protein
MLPDWNTNRGMYEIAAENEHVSLPTGELLKLFVSNCSQAQHDPHDSINIRLKDRSTGLPTQFAPLQLMDIRKAFWNLSRNNLRVLLRYHILIPVVSNRRLHNALEAAFCRDNQNTRSLKRLFSAPPASSE